MEPTASKVETFVPLYYRIVQEITARIKSGKLGSGERVPSENELRSRYKVSSTTARKALAELAREGWISQQKGRGSFVGRPLIDHSLARITSFRANMERMGRRPSTRLLYKRRQARGEKGMVIGGQQYILNAPYLHLMRLRLGDEVPIMLEHRFISLKLCPDLDSRDLSQSLFALYEEVYGCTLLKSRQSISATALGEDVADQLASPEGVPGFLVEGALFTTKGRLLELESCTYRGDQYRFVLEATK